MKAAVRSLSRPRGRCCAGTGEQHADRSRRQRHRRGRPDLRRGGRAPRRRIGVDGRGLGLRRVHPAGLPGRQDQSHPVGHQHRPAGFADAGAAGDVGDVDAGAVGRPVPARLGASGPQVMEGWHGVRFSSPLAMTRETIEVLRTVTAGERLVHDGAVYQLPLPGGAGRAIRSMAAPVRVPVYVASMGPKNLALTGELADGWLANTFMPETAAAFLEPLTEGAARTGRTPADLDVVVPVGVEFSDDE